MPKGFIDPIQKVRSKTLEVRLAHNEREVDAALALRYRVFYEELNAHPTPEMLDKKRDFDSFDEDCDHVLVIDHDRVEGNDFSNAVVGTYRLIRSEMAARHGGFYSAGEYDLSRLMEYPGRLLELGRSCVDANYRSRATMELLWRGIGAYVEYYDVDVLFGCASLIGTDPEEHAEVLTYLRKYHLAPPAIRPKALADRYVPMKTLDEVDTKRALASLPTLIKGYLRLGGFVGDGAVIDEQFNTTDVCVVVKRDLVPDKYFRHFDVKKSTQ
ncbi:MAG: GNAT family N-acetyltransferase [Alphaproteobacteria bacterium]|nr:GNAT family N-acetyltransferase [Alphaproteobacteria bacterium]